LKYEFGYVWIAAEGDFPDKVLTPARSRGASSGCTFFMMATPVLIKYPFKFVTFRQNQFING
jgi:hypothetical protein